MKKSIRILCLSASLFAGALPLANCSTNVANNIISASQSYDNAVQNFVNVSNALGGSVALTSQAMGPYCSALIVAGNAITSLASKSASATSALNSGAAALQSYCNNLPTDVPSAIKAVAAATLAAKNAAGS